MDEGLGAVATVLVQDGTLRVGDIMLCGSGYGRLRSILNDRGEMIQEATAAMRVTHPNICRVFDFGVLPDGLPYLIMEYLEGQPLSAVRTIRSCSVRCAAG